MTAEELNALLHDCGHAVADHHDLDGEMDECWAHVPAEGSDIYYGLCTCKATHDQAIAYAVTKLLEETQKDSYQKGYKYGYGWGAADYALRLRP